MGKTTQSIDQKQQVNGSILRNTPKTADDVTNVGTTSARVVPPPPTPLDLPVQNSVALDPRLQAASNSLKTEVPVVHSVLLNDAHHAGPERAAKMAAKLIEDSTFTFKPKVSQTSLKIAQHLNSDFMSRQQQHLDKQKKYVSTCNHAICNHIL